MMRAQRKSLNPIIGLMMRLMARWSCSTITPDTQQEIDRVASLVDGTVQVFLLACDLDVGLVYAPAPAYRALATTKCLFK